MAAAASHVDGLIERAILPGASARQRRLRRAGKYGVSIGRSRQLPRRSSTAAGDAPAGGGTASPARFPIRSPEGQQFPAGARRFVDISPDGTRIVVYGEPALDFARSNVAPHAFRG